MSSVGQAPHRLSLFPHVLYRDARQIIRLCELFAINRCRHTDVLQVVSQKVFFCRIWSLLRSHVPKYLITGFARGVRGRPRARFPDHRWSGVHAHPVFACGAWVSWVSSAGGVMPNGRVQEGAIYHATRPGTGR